MGDATNLKQVTREVFGNVAPWMQGLFYALMALSIAVLVWRVVTRARLWAKGQPGGFERDWKLWARRLAVFAAGQKRVHRKSLGAVLHILLSSGFVILTIGTTLLMIAHAGPVYFHVGWYYLFYELTLDVFGVAFIVGCLLAFYRRRFARPKALGHRSNDWLLLGSLLGLGITGFVVEALRLHYTQVPDPIARWSIVAWGLQKLFLQGMSLETARSLHLSSWWVHIVLVAAFFAGLPVTRFLHVIVGPMNIATRPERAVGALVPLQLEEVEKTGKVGVSELGQFRQQQLMSLDACMECGRCEEACPAWASNKPLSPKALVVDLRNAMSGRTGDAPLVGGVIKPETLWACTMCQACVQECPVLIGHVDFVSDMRRHLVGEGEIAGPPARAMAQLGKQGNPYGRPARERFAWANGLDVPTVDTQPDFEYLLWLGCSVSYDPRAQKVARAMVVLLRDAGVRFAVLGQKERCTGDPARRLGDEFLFQDLARSNAETLNEHKVRKIVTPCPHCMNSLRHEYAAFGGQFEVVHHSQLLAELVSAGRLTAPKGANDSSLAIHDPCYLARANDDVHSIRMVARFTGVNVQELPRHGRKTSCCGAGGGRMFFDELPAQRVSKGRADEVLASGARRLATGCPFCLNMMTDALASAPADKAVQVLDIAEILLAARTEQSSQPGGPAVATK